MALVQCDITSDQTTENPDIEDGEITDDDDDPQTAVPEAEPNNAGAPPIQGSIPPVIFNKPPTNVSDTESLGANFEGEHEKEMGKFPPFLPERNNRMKNRDGKRNKGDRNREDKSHRHMTEAEKSILHLRKREKMFREREKTWDNKHHPRRDSDPIDDDFAKNIEKTLATILNKKEKEVAGLSGGEEVKEEEVKKSKKRKRDDHDRDRKRHKHKKQMMMESPRSEIDENEMLNVRSGSPGADLDKLRLQAMVYATGDQNKRSGSPSRSEESYHSEHSSDERMEERSRRRQNKSRKKKEMKRERRERERRMAREEPKMQDAQGICVFYLQGKCQKKDCPYSHDVCPPMKLEVCKFYLQGCCAKGESCSYMHSEFPCKFYHTGIPCTEGKDCKFAHGPPLSDGLKQILFKHIETAPRDILQGYPRLSRDEALNLINQTQKKLEQQYGTAASEQLPSTASSHTAGFGMYRDRDQNVDRLQQDEEKEVPPSTDRRKHKNRWQQDDNDSRYPPDSFTYGTDQDMRFSSNGDVDMRTLPGIAPNVTESSSPKRDIDIRTFSRDVDIRQSTFSSMDVDIRQLPFESGDSNSKEGFPAYELSQTTKELMARISANQKSPDYTADVSIDAQQTTTNTNSYDDQNINWYSDDDDDDENRLTIKVEDEEVQKREREDSVGEGESDKQPLSYEPVTKSSFLSPPEISSKEIVDKLGDLSKIDISAEVTKLLTSMNQNKTMLPTTESSTGSPSTKPESGSSPSASDSAPSDPRLSRQTKTDPRQDPRLNDPRQRGRQNSSETKEKEAKKPEKMSIYEQGGLDMKRAALEIDGDDFKSPQRPDMDLRTMALPFKGMQNYTPATEIDASLSSHPAMAWKVVVVEIPRPDYSGLKLSINDAEKTGDPRLRKIFRLSIDEKDSPASPKASPKQGGGVRVDPRLRKMEEKPSEPKDLQSNLPMPYSQQLSMLQSSPFYQSLTSNQKLMLNQELAKNDQSGGGGMHDPVLNGLLANLNLLPQVSQAPNPMGPGGGGTAASILNNVIKMNPMMPNQPLVTHQGLLGAAPGIPNMQPDFPMNFDPRGAPGLLGNPPPGPGFGQYGGMEPNHQFGGNFNDDYYGYEDQGGNMGPQGGGNFRHGGRGFNNNNRDGRRRGHHRDGGFRGGRGNRNFHKRGGGMRDKGDRERGRGNRGHSPS